MERRPIVKIDIIPISSVPVGFVEFTPDNKALYNYRETFIPNFPKPKHVGRKQYGECYIWQLTDSKNNDVVFFVPNSPYTKSTIQPAFEEIFNIRDDAIAANMRVTLERVPNDKGKSIWVPIKIEYVEPTARPEPKTVIVNDICDIDDDDEQSVKIDQSISYWKKTIDEYLKKKPDMKSNVDALVNTMMNEERALVLTKRYNVPIRVLTKEEANKILNEI